MRALRVRSRTGQRWPLGFITPEGFAMTAGVLVPLDIELIEDAIADTPQLLRNRREELIDDRRFAEAIYRVALASGLMEQVAYQDTISEAG